jgi:hypothetical protein
MERFTDAVAAVLANDEIPAAVHERLDGFRSPRSARSRVERYARELGVAEKPRRAELGHDANGWNRRGIACACFRCRTSTDHSTSNAYGKSKGEVPAFR